MKNGLQKQNRRHVHLTETRNTAISVGKRYGKPVLLRIKAHEMHQNGFAFFISENNVWLTDHVPVTFMVTEKSIKKRSRDCLRQETWQSHQR
jgi:putative RNA 2'-phosphotransferase